MSEVCIKDVTLCVSDSAALVVLNLTFAQRFPCRANLHVPPHELMPSRCWEPSEPRGVDPGSTSEFLLLLLVDRSTGDNIIF